jgi:ComF family protein
MCLVCQTPAPFGKTHANCVSRNTIDGAIAGLNYKNRHVNEIIRMFKYNFVSDLASPLSQTIVEAMDNQGLNDYFKDFTILPVPLHKRRMNWRGFNQSELLSKALAEKLNIPIQKDLVLRQKFTTPQTTLSAAERKKNLDQAFALNANVAGQKILLVDDVVTSGATAQELAKILKQGKASEVWIITAAHG